jgi:hypothetical protein
MSDSTQKNNESNFSLIHLLDPNKLKHDLYKDFLFKMNFSNGIYVHIHDEIDRPYKFFVGRGNNSAIIKGIMRRRFHWQLVDKITNETNFVWTQLRVNDFVKGQKINTKEKELMKRNKF